MDQASGRRLDWLTILPTHRTAEGERYLNRVANVAKDFHYFKLVENPTYIAFADDYDGSAEEDEIGGPVAIATPPRMLHPEAERTDRRHTLLVCYGGWQLVQPFMAGIAVMARGHGRGAGFAVETVHGVGGDGGITEVRLELLRSWGWP
ncbi:hypothetical protein CYMTET_10150 [Cymbomonas tetramitiformis]|uniref:Uncharacterized protein n=1 Tax=Cymbomonas tetramitiformis TaxID=36881 RepID=A0AAE0LE42_9CHLO|nr:hypothetical protein CYMTET_10150 [Cymbomonas tetramitiformis]